jgi:hypothetical protein
LQQLRRHLQEHLLDERHDDRFFGAGGRGRQSDGARGTFEGAVTDAPLAGSLASLGKMEVSAALVKRGVTRFTGLLSIERFALNRYWTPTPLR